MALCVRAPANSPTRTPTRPLDAPPTSSHSPPFLPRQFNSWGRVPYLFPWPNGTISGGIKVRYDELAFNFIVAGGGANGGSFDHDGSFWAPRRAWLPCNLRAHTHHAHAHSPCRRLLLLPGPR